MVKTIAIALPLIPAVLGFAPERCYNTWASIFYLCDIFFHLFFAHLLGPYALSFMPSVSNAIISALLITFIRSARIKKDDASDYNNGYTYY